MDKCAECTCGGKGGLYCEWIRPHPRSFLSRIEALERENARLRDINAILEDCMSKGMVIRKKETE